MQKLRVLFFIIFVLSIMGCVPSEAAIVEAIRKTEDAKPAVTITPPSPTQEPICKNGVCIHQTLVRMDEENFQVAYIITDLTGKAEVGKKPEISDEQLIAVYLIEDKEETYLLGGKFNSPVFSCYSGNDIPWNYGVYSSTCGFILPTSQLQVRPKVGDIVRVENVTFDFSALVTIIEIEK